MITKAQLFESLTGKPQVITIDGIGEIKIKPLSLADVQTLQMKELEGIETSLEIIKMGMVEPDLEVEDLNKLRNSLPKKVFEIAKSISELSGMSEDDESFLEIGGKSSS